MPQPVYEHDKEEVFPIERPEGIPQGAELEHINSWFGKGTRLLNYHWAFLAYIMLHSLCRTEVQSNS